MILRYHSVPDWVTILGCEPYSVIIPNLLLSFSNSNNSNNNNNSDILPNLSLIFNLCHFQLTSTRSSTVFQLWQSNKTTASVISEQGAHPRMEVSRFQRLLQNSVNDISGIAHLVLNLTYKPTELAMWYFDLTCSLECLFERHTQIDFRQGKISQNLPRRAFGTQWFECP